jgi:hypothetical protein
MTQKVSKDFKATLKKMEKLFSYGVLYLYGYIDKDVVHTTEESFYRVSVCNQPLSLPKMTDVPLPEGAICSNLWGDPTASPTNSGFNAKYNCAFFLTSFATVLTILGFEVYVNDRQFDPEEGIEWRKL